MQPVMRLVLSSEGYENYRLASGRKSQATARLTHLFLATAKGLSAMGFAYASFKFSRHRLTVPAIMLGIVLPPPFLLPFIPFDTTNIFPKDPWLNFKAGLLAGAIDGIVVGGVIGVYKNKSWESFTRNVRGVWNPTQVAQEDYEKEPFLVLSTLIMRIAVFAAAVIVIAVSRPALLPVLAATAAAHVAYGGVSYR